MSVKINGEVVVRARKLCLSCQVHEESKVRKASLEGVVHQVTVDSKETVAVTVNRAVMVHPAFPDSRVCLVQMDGLDSVEDLERMACLVYQDPMVHLVSRAEMEVEGLRDHLA